VLGLLHFPNSIRLAVLRVRNSMFLVGERQNQVAKITYDEDLAEVILADDLGLQEAWISRIRVALVYFSPGNQP
jgi:hypothetical protein